MTKTKTPKLLNCPFCGSFPYMRETLITTSREDSSYCGESSCYQICCSKCLASADDHYHEEEAIKAWNKRAKPQHKEPSK